MTEFALAISVPNLAIVLLSIGLFLIGIAYAAEVGLDLWKFFLQRKIEKLRCVGSARCHIILNFIDIAEHAEGKPYDELICPKDFKTSAITPEQFRKASSVKFIGHGNENGRRAFEKYYKIR